ncbi:conserved hypothetical protein [Denitrovibrio acetiphilus DSM 12809]|uniref:Outer membrane protein beta-barrel domain-containing protein n=1 Tax=Denitrovibrio acetiphilus (strain DSM 12809 / NBRC 114555 / N2460) TaxID=522772 RepID=D4H5A8_DENA2|nr:hypothetical protein [Denitrovibrio acetiphilus]ADD67528.1 conserved hypothetical protein [Denitrovibrio acetiphilus DSM 12809]
MKKLLVLAAMMVSSVVFADEFKIQNSMTQSQFQDLSKEMGQMVTPTPNSPAEPLKTLGFDIALETTLVNISDGDSHWKNAWDNGDPDSMALLYRVHVQKGFPFGIDLGLSVTKGTNIDFTAITGEVKYAILKGTTVTPALSVKGSYTKVFGLDDIDLQTLSAGIYVSKGILMFTPYGGLETVYTMASDDSDADLDDENVNAVRGIVGLQFSPLPLISINGEIAVGTVTSYGLKAGLRF